MSQAAAGFMSYVRFDDAHESGRLTEFCKRLSGEVRFQTGETFPIFQDRNDIAWGQQWQQRIDDSLDAATFLIPIITPGFFKSPPCRAEFERFLEREKQLRRNDLILPVYYVNYPILDDEAKRDADPLMKIIASRQHADWRELRFDAFTSPQVGRMLARMASQIVEALERGTPAAPAPVPARAASQPAAASVPTTEPAREAETSRRSAPKTEPPTRVVDALHRGDHATLREAIKAARPGDRILVRPGL
jgi:TIR domain